MYVEKMLRQGTEGMRISICSKSVAALNVLDSVLVSSKLVSECKNSLNTLGSQNKITLYWVPAHMGIPGNKKADSLVKKETKIAAPTTYIEY